MCLRYPLWLQGRELREGQKIIKFLIFAIVKFATNGFAINTSLGKKLFLDSFSKAKASPPDTTFLLVS